MTCDFFTVDTVLLRRLSVLPFIHHDSLLVGIAGVTATPSADWVTQQARNLSMELANQTNTICERVIGTIRRECLDRTLILGRRHLEAVLAEYRSTSSITTPTVPIGLSAKLRHPHWTRLQS